MQKTSKLLSLFLAFTMLFCVCGATLSSSALADKTVLGAAGGSAIAASADAAKGVLINGARMPVDLAVGAGLGAVNGGLIGAATKLPTAILLPGRTLGFAAGALTGLPLRPANTVIGASVGKWVGTGVALAAPSRHIHHLYGRILLPADKMFLAAEFLKSEAIATGAGAVAGTATALLTPAGILGKTVSGALVGANTKLLSMAAFGVPNMLTGFAIGSELNALTGGVVGVLSHRVKGTLVGAALGNVLTSPVKMTNALIGAGIGTKLDLMTAALWNVPAGALIGADVGAKVGAVTNLVRLPATALTCAAISTPIGSVVGAAVGVPLDVAEFIPVATATTAVVGTTALVTGHVARRTVELGTLAAATGLTALTVANIAGITVVVKANKKTDTPEEQPQAFSVRLNSVVRQDVEQELATDRQLSDTDSVDGI